MAELDDFNDVTTSSLEDFDTGDSIPRGMNKATSENRASYTALLDSGSGSVEESFKRVKGEMQALGHSRTADSILKETAGKRRLEEQESLIDVVADQSVDFEVKRNAALSFVQEVETQPNLRNELSKQMVLEDSEGENFEMETVRINTGARIQELNELKRQRQALVNSEVARSNSTTMETVVDFFETMVPFTESKRLATLVSQYRGEEELSDKATTFGDMLFLTGSDKAALRDSLMRMSPEARMEASQSLIDAINSSDELLLPDENDLTRVDFIKTFLEDGYYTSVDEWVDNAISLLDMTIIGSAVSRSVKSVRSLVKSTSVAENVKDVNPSKAKALHEAARVDETGEVAGAAYGADRTESLVDGVVYEIAEEEGVRNKVGNIGSIYDQEVTPDPAIMDIVKSDGAIYYWEDEKKKARANVFNDFQNPTGLRLRSEMQSIGTAEGSGININAIYGPTDGGFATAQDAFDVTKSALRKYGIKDENIDLMMQHGDMFKPVPKELTQSVLDGKIRPVGGFLTRVKYDYTVSPLDIEEWSKADVKWNLFDRIPGSHTKTQGSLQRHLLDAHSMLHPNITFGASVAVDKAAGLEKSMLELGKKFTDSFSSLKSDRQDLVFDYILEANSKGIGLDKNKLVAEGYRPEEIDALEKWRSYWDTHFVLEDRDLRKTAIRKGYQALDDKTGGTTLFAKPVGKQTLNGSVDVYDPADGVIRKISGRELDELYENGGSVAKLKDPIEKSGDAAVHTYVKGTSDSYLRGISESDNILNYRKGYFSVNYTAPKFIVKRVKNKNGEVVFERAIQMAGNTRDADMAARRLAKTEGRVYDNLDPKADYFVRDNVKNMRMDSDDYWSLQTAGGRSAQRMRGERLEDAGGETTIGEKEWVMGPVDSLIHSARSISRRVPMRDYLDATKERFLSQYSNVLPKDEFGRTSYPKNSSEIGAIGRKGSKEAADARTTYEYIKSLEDGYINGMDEAYKATLKWISGIFGEASKGKKGVIGKALAKGEEGLEALSEAQGPVGFSKNVAFQAYLASHPLRQAVIQSHQSILLIAANPSYMLSGQFFREMTAVSGYLTAVPFAGRPAALSKAAKFAGMSTKDFTDMMNAWEKSGIGSAVDKQNLVRGTLSELASYGKYGGSKSLVAKAATPVTAPLHLSRRVGFDTGEYFTSLSSWMAYHNKVKKDVGGRKLTSEDYDTISAKSRNFNLNMNQAGEMPYNQNSLGLFFQFLQVPHKMFTTMVFNRGLTGWERARLAGLNFTLFGIGGNAMYNFVAPLLPEDQELKDAVSNGLEGWAVNTVLSQAYEGDTRIDFSSVAPTDMYGMSSFLTSLWTESPGNILVASPSGQLFFGNNPRITNAFKDAARYFHLMEDDGNPVTLSQTLEGFAKISSGYSSYAKAKMAFDYQLKKNAYGKVIDENVTTPEAAAALLGFNTIDERDYYLSSTDSYEKSKAFEDDFNTWYRDFKRIATAQGVDPENSDYVMRAINSGLAIFEGNRPRFEKLLFQRLKYDVEVDKDFSLYESAIRAAGFMDGAELKNYINNLPLEDQSAKGQLLELLDYQINGDNE